MLVEVKRSSLMVKEALSLLLRRLFSLLMSNVLSSALVCWWLIFSAGFLLSDLLSQTCSLLVSAGLFLLSLLVFSAGLLLSSDLFSAVLIGLLFLLVFFAGFLSSDLFSFVIVSLLCWSSSASSSPFVLVKVAFVLFWDPLSSGFWLVLCDSVLFFLWMVLYAAFVVASRLLWLVLCDWYGPSQFHFWY